MRDRRQLILGAGAVLGTLVGGLGYQALRRKDDGRAGPALPLSLADMDWRLVDQRGSPVTPADWLGDPVLVFFGFTWCPDVCPTTLSNIAIWLEELGPEAERLVVALITVDPERDSPAVLGEYVDQFDPRILGLSGPPEMIARTADAFRVRYESVPTDSGDYTMDHTAGVFLFRSGGAFAGIIDFHENPDFAVPKIRRILT